MALRSGYKGIKKVGPGLELSSDGWLEMTGESSMKLDNLQDVNITTPAAGATLVYDGSKWINGPACVDWSSYAKTGAVNLFNKDTPPGDYNNTTITTTSTGFRVLASSAGAYRGVTFSLTIPSGMDLKFTADTTITTGQAYFKVQGSNDKSTWTTLGESTILSASGKLSVSFNTGSYNYYIVSFYCNAGTSSVGDVTYSNVLLTVPNNATYAPYAMTNKELTDSKVDWSSYAKTGVHQLLDPSKVAIQSQEVSGVTVTKNGLEIALSGTASADIDLGLVALADTNALLSKYGNLVLSGANDDCTISTYFLYLSTSSGNKFDTGDGIELTENVTYRWGLQIKSGTNVTGKTINLMIRLATDTNTTPAPYAMTNGELTDAVATKVVDIKADLKTALMEPTGATVTDVENATLITFGKLAFINARLNKAANTAISYNVTLPFTLIPKLKTTVYVNLISPGGAGTASLASGSSDSTLALRYGTADASTYVDMTVVALLD